MDLVYLVYKLYHSRKKKGKSSQERKYMKFTYRREKYFIRKK